MGWESANKFPLVTESCFGDIIPIGERHSQIRADLDYDWLVNPPEIYQRAWREYKSGGSQWRFGSLKTEEKTKEAFQMGMPTDSLLKAYEKASKQLEVIVLPNAPTVRRKRWYNMDDGEPDIDKALGGSEEYLIRRKHTKVEKRIVHLAWQLAHNCCEDETSFSRQAATAVAVASHLEKFGYRVRLTGYFAIETDNGLYQLEAQNLPEHLKPNRLKELVISVLIKPESQPLDEHKTLSFGFPGVFRYFVFAWMTAISGSSINKNGKIQAMYMGRSMYDNSFNTAIRRRDKITASVSSDGPLTMRSVLMEIGEDDDTKPE